MALAARDLLAKDGISASVVSMPSWELFEAQDATYRQQVLGADGTVRVACEAVLVLFRILQELQALNGRRE